MTPPKPKTKLKRPRIASRGVTKKIPLKIVQPNPEELLDRLEQAIGRIIAALTILQSLVPETSKRRENG